MPHTRNTTLAALGLVTSLLVACGSDDEGGAPPEGGRLAGICPSTVVIQTDWYPEAEHGFIYALLGEDYTVDKGGARVRGSLVAAGADTGVDLEIRSGGPAISASSVSEELYNDDGILLGFVYTDEAIQMSERFPTVAVESGFEKNPQMIMWDPATYPDVRTIADLKATGAIVRHFPGRAYMEYFADAGILDRDQLDGSYTGGTDLFTGDEGNAAQQGFGSAEPYIYEHEVADWMRPVRYAYVHDAGWESYAQSIATKPEHITEHAACFAELVPMVQRSSIDYLEHPERADAIILDAVETFDTFWVYSQAVADYGKETMRRDGLLSNGPDDIVGNFDLDRVNGLIEIAVPVYADSTNPPQRGLRAEDIVTNQFVDERIGF